MSHPTYNPFETISYSCEIVLNKQTHTPRFQLLQPTSRFAPLASLCSGQAHLLWFQRFVDWHAILDRIFQFLRVLLRHLECVLLSFGG